MLDRSLSQVLQHMGSENVDVTLLLLMAWWFGERHYIITGKFNICTLKGNSCSNLHIECQIDSSCTLYVDAI